MVSVLFVSVRLMCMLCLLFGFLLWWIRFIVLICVSWFDSFLDEIISSVCRVFGVSLNGLLLVCSVVRIV